MHEVIINLHMHTRYSDGSGLHKDIAAAAFKAGVDVVIVTDHNILVNGFEGYYKEKNKKILTQVTELTGEQREEELARMLAGATITPEARKAAQKLLEQAA